MKFSLLILSIFLLSSFKVNPSSDAKVNWLTFNDLTEKLKENKKPVIIDVYTDWCHWCKVMEKETYQNKKVAEYINQNYYAVSFNAEGKDDITFRNKVFSYDPQYKINMLTVALTNGQLSFPTTVIIPDENSAPIAVPGYLKPRELELIVKYFGSGANKTQSFPDFQKTFHATW